MNKKIMLSLAFVMLIGATILVSKVNTNLGNSFPSFLFETEALARGEGDSEGSYKDCYCNKEKRNSCTVDGDSANCYSGRKRCSNYNSDCK